jgi:hypothetical protein
MTALGRLRSAVSTALVRALNRRPGIVLCHKSADLPHWRTLLAQAGSEVLVVALDDPELTRLRTVTGAAHPLVGCGYDLSSVSSSAAPRE